MRGMVNDPVRRNLLVAVVGVGLLPVLLQLPLLLGFLHANPMLLFSGLASNVAQPVPGLSTIDPNIGFTSQALGILAAHDWLHGSVPWWNPYEGTGVPLAGEMQSAALFLPFVLLLAVAHGQLWFHIALQIIAGMFTLALLRELKLPLWAAVVGAVLFEFNGTFSWLANAVVNPVAFLPMVLYGIERIKVSAEQGQVHGWHWVAIGLAYSVYAGFPETAYVDGLFAVLWGAVRLWQLPRAWRARYMWGVVLGGISGIALASPVIVAFATYLKYAYVGPLHSGGFGDAFLPLPGLAMLAWPYVFGPIFGFSGTAGIQTSLTVLWGNVGGYTGVGVLALGLAGVLGRDERPLRVALAAFIVVALARTFGQPAISHMLNAVPLLGRVAFFRYADPAWELALCVLAAFAVADMQKLPVLVWPRLVAVLAAFLIALGMLYSGRGIISALVGVSGYPEWLVGSLALGIGSFLLLMFAFAGRHPLRPMLLGIAVVVESLCLFLIPVMAHPRTGTLHTKGVAFLQTHIGLHRFYTLGPIAPNYGSAFGIASLNYNDLPVASNLVSYVHRTLDPYANAIVFNGTYPRPSVADPSQANVLRHRLGAYEAAGVKFVVTPPDVNPFVSTFFPTTLTSGNEAYDLPSGSTLTVVLNNHPRGKLLSIGLLIGTYNGQADGVMGMQLCQSGKCVDASGRVADAQDNSYFILTLPRPVTLSQSPLTLRISDFDAREPFAVWLWPERGGQAITGRPGWGTHMQLNFAVEASPPKQVYAGTTMDIFQTSSQAKYFSANECKLTIGGRTNLHADCSRPSSLIRLETYAVGWHAEVNGVPTRVSQYKGLFQEVFLPAGRSRVTFLYSPPGIAWALLALVIGLGGILWSVVLGALWRAMWGKARTGKNGTVRGGAK